MKKSIVMLVCIGVISFLALGIGAAPGPKKVPPGQAKKGGVAETDVTTYLSKAGLSGSDQAGLAYYFGLAGLQTNADEVVTLWRLDPSGLEVTFRLGFPPVLLDGELLVWRHPPILHSPLPLAREKHRQRFEHHWGWEQIDRGPNKYAYTYVDKVHGITEEIQVKPQKYSYRYQDPNIEERLEIQFAANKYEYTYHNRLTKEQVKRSGAAEFIRLRDIARYIPQETPPQAPQWSFKIEFNFKFD